MSLAQPQQKVLADKIVAVVGDKIILKSDIDNSLADMMRQGVELPPNAKCLTLEQMMGVKALVLQAEKDSLPVSDEEVETDIENRIRYFINAYGSKDELERVAGKSVYQLKEDMRGPIKDQKMATTMRDKVVSGIKITPNEVKAYFDKIPADSLAYYEAEVEIGQIIMYPKASRDAEEYALSQLVDIKNQIEGGKDFRSMAMLYSDDPSAKQNGGQFEVNRTQKDFDPIWMAKAFALKEGQISSPFKTRFGYHIVQMLSRAGDDAILKHILKTPQVTQIEINEGLSKMDSVRANLISGTIDFGTAVDKYSDDEMSKFTGGMIQGPNGTFLTIDQLDKSMIPIYQKLKVGEYSQPTEFTDERGKKGIRIVYLKTQTQPHRENLKDDYSKIASRALEEKKDQAIEDWFRKKITGYYIKIDDEYKNCDGMKKWLENSSQLKLK
ncbi:MAG TPA: peptidylprolyl isomerase [Ferruginibacter sp.]|nr:peptidylprolyl isomerase [Ferruginibacter sp.]